MMEKTYHFVISVKLPDGRISRELHNVRESWTDFGASLALGKVVSYYEDLKYHGKIKDFRITEE